MDQELSITEPVARRADNHLEGPDGQPLTEIDVEAESESLFEVIDDDTHIHVREREDLPGTWSWDVTSLEGALWRERRLTRHPPGIGCVRGDSPSREEAIAMARWALTLIGTFPASGRERVGEVAE